jgi:mannosylglycerate hydrolase
MNTVAPEALIRNLLVGKKMTEHFGGGSKTGYTATSYGQISQLAQIYAGFDIKAAMSYRGTNKHQVPPICKLQSPDGTQIYHIRCFDEVTRTNWFFFPHYMLVLGKNPRDLSAKWNPAEWPVHSADAGLYETAFQLKNEKTDFNKNPQDIQKAMRMLIAQAQPQIINNQLLALDMEDNAVPYTGLPELIKAVNKAQNDCVVKQSSLDEYVEACLKNLNESQMHVHKGEMRYTAIEAGFNGLLGATHSSRVNLKIANDLAQRELINVAEPLSSISAMLGGSYEKTLLDRAWLYLLKNHAHDSICGAAIDYAHLDNPFRFRAATSIAKECSRKATEEIWLKIDTKGKFQDGDLTLTFFNTLPNLRKRIEFVIVDTPRPNFGNFKIETCTGVGPIAEGFEPDKMLTFQYFDIVDENGNSVPYVILERENIDMEIERKLDSNASVYDILRNRLLIEVDIPAMGYRTYAVRPRLRKYNFAPQPVGEQNLLAANDGILENEFIKVKINSNGTFDITDKQNGKTICGLHYFCDDASTGNAHKHKGTLRDFTVTSLCGNAVLTLVENNPLRASWKIEQQMQIPSQADANAKDRSAHKTILPICTLITLTKDSRLVEIKTTVENSAKDHRLRIMLPTDIKTDYAYADAPFDVVKRNFLRQDVADNMEEFHPYQPMQRFVTVSDEKSGFSFISKGLGEYEVIDDKRRTLAVTLLRTTRAYMKANRGQMTPEELEQNLGQHCIGKLEYQYAICMHQQNWKQAKIHIAADDYRTPVRILQAVPKAGTLPPTNSLIKIEKNDALQISAFFKSDIHDGYILRIWNTDQTTVESKIIFNMPTDCVDEISLDERRIFSSSKADDGKINVKLRPAEIKTLLIKQKTAQK